MATIKKGSKGKQVNQLQVKLNKAGAKPKLNVDSVFGPLTETALKQYQKKHKLKSDGIAGSGVLFALGIGPRPEHLTIDNWEFYMDWNEDRMTRNYHKMYNAMDRFDTAIKEAETLKGVLVKRRDTFDGRWNKVSKVSDDHFNRLHVQAADLQKKYEKTRNPTEIASIIKQMKKNIEDLERGKEAKEQYKILKEMGATLKELHAYEVSVAKLKAKL